MSDTDLLKPSAAFKKNAALVVLSIIIFFLIYLSLIAISLALLIGSFFAGISIISAHPSFLTIALGICIIGLGTMIFVFLVKFVFSFNRDENPSRVQIHEHEQPELFAFIRDVADEVQTKFPKKIFLVPDVNAAVFYNSSFWSMFFPVRKNLDIGLGLINALNISEFKAILAHEFGHFSQKSTKIGSYVYTVNRALYNLVFEYDSWDRIMHSWANAGGIVGFFAGLTVWLVELIRKFLHFAYHLINLQYMKLSREMEYHADLIAANIAGRSSMISALRRTEFAAMAFDQTLNYLNQLSEKNQRTADVFNNHRFVIRFFGKAYKLKESNGLPVITDGDLEKNLVKQRVNVKDQWASHPEREEREANINRITNDTPTINEDAWRLLGNLDIIKQRATDKLYEIAFPQKELNVISSEAFEAEITDDDARYKISERFNGFYDNRMLNDFDLTHLAKRAHNRTEELTFEAIYNADNKSLIDKHFTNKQDLNVVEAIIDGSVDTTFFEFDGLKYKKKDAPGIKEKLEAEIDKENAWLQKLDEHSFEYNFLLANAKNKNEELIEIYQKHFEVQKITQKSMEFYGQNQQFFYILSVKTQWTEDETNNYMQEMNKFEDNYKTWLKTIPFEQVRDFVVNEEQRKSINGYVGLNAMKFLSAHSFDNEKYLRFANILHDINFALNQWLRLSYKKLTDFQLGLYR